MVKKSVKQEILNMIRIAAEEDNAVTYNNEVLKLLVYAPRLPSIDPKPKKKYSYANMDFASNVWASLRSLAIEKGYHDVQDLLQMLLTLRAQEKTAKTGQGPAQQDGN